MSISGHIRMINGTADEYIELEEEFASIVQETSRPPEENVMAVDICRKINEILNNNQDLEELLQRYTRETQ